jgi:hypothetical protein
MSTRGAMTAVFVCALAVGSLRTLHAQVAAGALTGQVIDHAGASVPGATISAREVRTNMVRAVVSGADGGYAIVSLSPGLYRIRTELSGFRPVVRDGVTVSTGETVRLDFQLEVGGLSETVTVTGDAPVLRTNSASLGQVVDSRAIGGLPLNGRSFISLATLAPGVAMPPPPAAALPRINGGRPRTNE